MASSVSSADAPVGAALQAQSDVWSHLQQAIAKSSGFKRWQLECQDADRDRVSLDRQVSNYLRETLETLAY